MGAETHTSTLPFAGGGRGLLPSKSRLMDERPGLLLPTVALAEDAVGVQGHLVLELSELVCREPGFVSGVKRTCLALCCGRFVEGGSANVTRFFLPSMDFCGGCCFDVLDENGHGMTVLLSKTPQLVAIQHLRLDDMQERGVDGMQGTDLSDGGTQDLRGDDATEHG